MAFVATRVSFGHKNWCDGYRVRLRITRVLWCLQKQAKDQNVGFCAH